VVLTLQEPLLFKPQQAKLTEDGVALLDRVGRAVLALKPGAVRVEGHSDNSTIKWELFGSFTSHWELSAARATAVAGYLHEHTGLDPRHLTASGFGEFHPVQGNDTPEGRAANRRIVLVIEPAAQ
jgi:chemotaxis protein MotB